MAVVTILLVIACINGGLWGRSWWRRMAETTGGSVRNARILISPPQAGQSSGSTS
jgi:hypothetical protein